MDTLSINPTNDTQAINDAISATKPGASVIFESGEYILDRSLRFVSGRIYISHGAVLRCTPEWKGPIVEVAERPDSEKSRLEKALANRPILRRIATCVCRLFRITIYPGTFIAGFTLMGSGTNIAIHHLP